MFPGGALERHPGLARVLVMSMSSETGSTSSHSNDKEATLYGIRPGAGCPSRMMHLAEQEFCHELQPRFQRDVFMPLLMMCEA